MPCITAGCCGWCAARGGIRIYGLHAQEVRLKADTTGGASDRRVRLDALVDVVVARRRWGYCALPLLWRDKVVGWANAVVSGGALTLDVGYAAGQAPRERRFSQALADERARLCAFLGLVD